MTYEDDDLPEVNPWDSSMGLSFSIDMDLKNHKLNQQQRDALRTMMLMALTEISAKVELLGLRDRVTVRAEERASGAGKRNMVIPLEATHE